MTAKIEPLLTVADLDACPDDNNRYELIEGELFVSRARGIPHQRVLLNLQIELGLYLRGYWIVDPRESSVRIFRLRVQTLEKIATLTGNDELTSPILPGFRLKVGAIFNL